MGIWYSLHNMEPENKVRNPKVDESTNTVDEENSRLEDRHTGDTLPGDNGTGYETAGEREEK